MISHKRGLLFLTGALTVPLLIVFVIGLLVFFGGASILVYALGKVTLQIVGGAVLILSGVAMIKGVKVPSMVWYVGLALVLLPFIFSGLRTWNLASVLGTMR